MLITAFEQVSRRYAAEGSGHPGLLISLPDRLVARRALGRALRESRDLRTEEKREHEAFHKRDLHTIAGDAALEVELRQFGFSAHAVPMKQIARIGEAALGGDDKERRVGDILQDLRLTKRKTGQRRIRPGVVRVQGSCQKVEIFCFTWLKSPGRVKQRA